MKRKLLTTLLCGAVLLAACGSAQAEGFALYEYSARGVGLGGATVARKADASAIASNAAAITQLKGSHFQTGTSIIMPRGAVETKYGDNSAITGIRSDYWVIPNFYYTQQLTDTLYAGIGEFSRFGLGFEYPHNWPGRYNVYQVSLKTASLNPVLAWKATDSLSIAGGVEIMHLSLNLKKKLPVGPAQYYNSDAPQVDSNIRNAESTAFGLNLATHYQFTEQWAAGLQYRSQMRHRAKGTNELSLENVPASGLKDALARYDGKSYDVRGTVNLPDSFSGGVSWTPRKDLSIEVGATFTRWSTFDTLRIHTEDIGVNGTGSVSESKKKWDDVWRFNIGAEYSPLDWLTLRAGYVFDQSPMTKGYADYLVPTEDRHIFSGGLGFKMFEKVGLDMAYAYIMPGKRKYDEIMEKDGINYHMQKGSTVGNPRTHIVSASISYEF